MQRANLTDDKQTASPQLALCPRRSLVAFPAKVPQNFCLQRIGVLEFIDENARIMPFELLDEFARFT